MPSSRRRTWRSYLVLAESRVSVEGVARLGPAEDSIYRRVEHKDSTDHNMRRFWKFKLAQVEE